MGKFERAGWGFKISGRFGWMTFENVPFFVFLLSYLLPSSSAVTSPESLPTRYTLAALYLAHYIHRAYIYPLSAPSLAPTNITIVGLAGCFNIMNGYINGRTASFVGEFSGDEVRDWTFWAGVAVFVIGMAINVISDHTMFAMRRKYNAAKGKKSDDAFETTMVGDRTYFLPRGFLWDYVAAPHYFGEVVEWTGYALAARTPASVAFAIFTFGNLVPRGIQAHEWYIKSFGDRYPAHRRAVFPFLW
ncbi:3-oxo-5-alpha-steroid 4-dehydrogenase-domain-containing protein [Cladochytrium replicatum]|nr:3-oxo-5-alpha-steroid 4-dehydrogenase-domain-containing protein [Cladochytrium replicatum]